jgi:hypothetical protein
MKDTKLTAYVSEKHVLAFEIGEIKKTKTEGKGKNKVEVPIQGSGAIIVPENKEIDPVRVNNMFLAKFKPVKGDFYVIEEGQYPIIKKAKTFLEEYAEVAEVEEVKKKD